MKKALFLLAVSCIFGGVTVVETPSSLKVATKEKISLSRGHVYVRLNVAEPNRLHQHPIIPGVGIGYRKVEGSFALDFSGGYSQKRYHGKTEFISLPKMSYLYYFSPLEAQSLYVGPGIGYGRIKERGHLRFEGLIPSASVGYELSRKAGMLAFFQLDLSLPSFPTRHRGPLPGMAAEFAFGAGF